MRKGKCIGEFQVEPTGSVDYNQTKESTCSYWVYIVNPWMYPLGGTRIKYGRIMEILLNGYHMNDHMMVLIILTTCDHIPRRYNERKQLFKDVSMELSPNQDIPIQAQLRLSSEH